MGVRQMFATPVICLLASGAAGEENEKARFGLWLRLFVDLDENFSGPKAVEAKRRAHSVADTFR
jgi:hypothetical protein